GFIALGHFIQVIGVVPRYEHVRVAVLAEEVQQPAGQFADRLVAAGVSKGVLSQRPERDVPVLIRVVNVERQRFREFLRIHSSLRAGKGNQKTKNGTANSQAKERPRSASIGGYSC